MVLIALLLRLRDQVPKSSDLDHSISKLSAASDLNHSISKLSAAWCFRVKGNMACLVLGIITRTTATISTKPATLRPTAKAITFRVEVLSLESHPEPVKRMPRLLSFSSGEAARLLHLALWPTNVTIGVSPRPLHPNSATVVEALFPFAVFNSVSTRVESMEIVVPFKDKHSLTSRGDVPPCKVPNVIDPHIWAEPLTIMEPDNCKFDVQLMERFCDTTRVTFAPIMTEEFKTRDPLMTIVEPTVVFSW
jgi:hypothetical protein